jgi:hypothetical protein
MPAERHRQQGVGAVTARQPEQLEGEAPVAQTAAIAHTETNPFYAESVELGRQVVRALLQHRDHRPDAVPLPDPAQLQGQPRSALGRERAEDDQDPPCVLVHDGSSAMRETGSDLPARCQAS